jgi:hypothetical protein
MKLRKESTDTFEEHMKKLRKSVTELKKAADEAGADIDNYSLDYKLYLENTAERDKQLSAAEKRKKLFEEKSNNKRILK